MHNLWVELSRIQLLLSILHGCHWAYRSVSCLLEALWYLCNIVCVTHPADGLVIHICKQLGCLVNLNLCSSILADRGRADLAAQQMSHEL